MRILTRSSHGLRMSSFSTLRRRCLPCFPRRRDIGTLLRSRTPKARLHGSLWVPPPHPDTSGVPDASTSTDRHHYVMSQYRYQSYRNSRIFGLGAGELRVAPLHGPHRTRRHLFTSPSISPAEFQEVEPSVRSTLPQNASTNFTLRNTFVLKTRQKGVLKVFDP